MLVVCGSALDAQVRVEVKAGYGVSGRIVRDEIASEVLRRDLDGKVEPAFDAALVSAPMGGAGLAFVVSPRTEVLLAGNWSLTRLRVTDVSGERDVQDVSVVMGVLSVRQQLDRTLELSAGFGAVRFGSEDRGMFRGGAAVAPLLEAGAGAGLTRGAHRYHIRGVGQFHRFSTAALDRAGAQEGNVFRYGVEASFTWNGGDR